MSIYISYHPLDHDFSHRVLIFLRNVGLDARLCSLDDSEQLHFKAVHQDKLISVLRPEYVKSVNYPKIDNLIEFFSGFFPILRAPISIDEWSAHGALRPIADFTSLDKKSMDLSLKILQNAIVLNGDQQRNEISSPKEMYLNNLTLVLKAYLYPMYSLERVNYDSHPESELPFYHYLNKTYFEIHSSSPHNTSNTSANLTRLDLLENIVRNYKSFVIACNDIDSLAIACYLVDLARHSATTDINAPIPIFLNVHQWHSDVSWEEWIQSQITFSDTPIEDIATGRCALYAYGLDHFSFKTHPQKNTFERWLYGNSFPKHFITICAHADNIESHLLSDVVVKPIESNLVSFQQLCTEYAQRPFGQFLNTIIENKKRTSLLNYLLNNPVLTVMLLSVRFNIEPNFEQLSVGDYFDQLIENLWQIATSLSHEDQTTLDQVINPLSQLAADCIEQQLAGMTYENVFLLLRSKTLIAKCADAGIFLVNDSVVHFSMPTIQDYFAAHALVQLGNPPPLPTLTLNNQLGRIAQSWDKSILLYCHLSRHKDNLLKHLAESDPLLALRAIADGVVVSPSIYSYIVEQNLKAMVALGDFRIDFATLLYRINPDAAKSIFIEVLRDAHWSIRCHACTTFIELEASFLPGLADAVTDLTDDTRNKISKALNRLGANSLPTLFKLLRKDSAQTRLNAAWALGELRDKASVPALVVLLQDNNAGVSKQVIESLALLQDINCVPYLVQYLYKVQGSARKLAITALTNLQCKAPMQFATFVHTMDATTKRLIIEALHPSRSNSFIDLLMELLQDESVDVRIAAITALGDYPETRVISRLEDCLDDMSKSRVSKSTVSDVVSKVLSNIQKVNSKTALAAHSETQMAVNDASVKSSEIVKARLLHLKEERIKEKDVPPVVDKPTEVDNAFVYSVLGQLRERTWTNSSNAAKTLREYIKNLHGKASLNVINQILETLNDPDWMIRWTGVEALGWSGNVYVVPHLVQRLADTNWKIRIAAIRSLSEIGDKTAVAGLAKLLSDNNSVVREAAAEALGYLDAHEVMQTLEAAAIDEEDFVRLAVIESLGRMHQKAATETLLSALKDKSEHVRWAAANGLVGISTPEIIPLLIPSLSDTAGPYWEQKRICDIVVDILKQIGTTEALNAIAEQGNGQS